MFIYSLLLLLSSAIILYVSSQCTISQKAFEKCIQRSIVITDPNATLPVTDNELDDHCNKWNENLYCIRNYTRFCAKGFSQSIMNILSYDLKKEFKNRCKNKEGRKEFLKNMQCGKDIGFPGARTCSENLIIQLEYIQKKVDKDHKFLTICCAFHQMHECVINKIGEQCDHVTGKETKEYIEKMIYSTATESMEFMCTKYHNLEVCNSTDEKEIWNTVFEIGNDPSKADFVRKHTSIIGPMLEILSEEE